MLEPRQTTIGLKNASPDMVTIHIVTARQWEATLNVSLVDLSVTSIVAVIVGTAILAYTV